MRNCENSKKWTNKRRMVSRRVNTTQSIHRTESAYHELQRTYQFVSFLARSKYEAQSKDGVL